MQECPLKISFILILILKIYIYEYKNKKTAIYYPRVFVDCYKKQGKSIYVKIRWQYQ